LKPLPNNLLVIIIKIILTTNYQLLLNCNKVHRAGTQTLNLLLLHSGVFNADFSQLCVHKLISQYLQYEE
jgi:hypothetical protein